MRLGTWLFATLRWRHLVYSIYQELSTCNLKKCQKYWIMRMLVDFLWRCFIKGDFSTAASQNVVCIILKKRVILYNDLVSQLLCDKDVSNKKCNVFVISWIKQAFALNKKSLSTKSALTQLLQNRPLCSSTFFCTYALYSYKVQGTLCNFSKFAQNMWLSFLGRSRNLRLVLSAISRKIL